MKKNDHRVGVFSAVFVLLVIGAAWYALFGQSVLQSRIKEQTRSVQAQPPLLDITGLEDAYDAILNKSTKEFIGYHAIDEGFLSWFTGNYGVEALENIAAYATLDNPDVWHRITGSSIHVLWYRYCKETGIQEYALDRICEKECSSPYEIVLDFTGDFSLADGVGTTDFYRQNDSDMSRCIDAALLEEMRGADILVVNNEFVYSSDGEPLPKKDYHFRADPSTVEELAFLGVDAAGVANNHVFDYGEEGLLHTLETLEDAGMPYMGAGRDLEEASEPLYFIANGRKIAIVAATQIERSANYTKEATMDSAGVLKTLDPQKYTQVIAKAKKNADYVICFVHWGTEWQTWYGQDQQTLARAFVAAGADAVIGGHTHCLQGVEQIDGVPVFYSLGNFYFSQDPWMPGDFDSGMAQLVIQSDGTLEARFLPCRFSGGVLSLVEDGGEYRRILEEMEANSPGCAFDGNGYLIAK